MLANRFWLGFLRIRRRGGGSGEGKGTVAEGISSMAGTC